MNIISSLSEKDFINVNFYLLYKKLFVRIVTIIMVISVILTSVGVFFVENISLKQLLFPVLFLLVTPALVYFSAKKMYKSNKRIGEAIEYQFEKEALSIKGESFTSQLSWDKVFKITQSKNWLLIWQSSNTANIIPRRFVDTMHVAALKQIAGTYKIKNNL